MVNILFITILISMTGCAAHQDLLAPQHPGEQVPVNHIWEALEKESSE